MPISPNEIIDILEDDFNSTELSIIIEIMEDIDDFLISNYSVGCSVWYNKLYPYYERIKRNRRTKFIDKISSEYAEVGWKVKYHSENVLIFEKR